MQILTNHLEAVLLAAAKKDIRYYLNGVHVNKHHLVATDGHRMHIVCHGGDWPHDPVTIPRTACELAIKGKTASLELTPSAIGPISYQPVDGQYPDYTRVMAGRMALNGGVSEGDQFANVQWEFLRDADAAIKLATGKKLSPLALIGNAFVWSNPQIQVVVMPYAVFHRANGEQYYSLEPLAC